MVAKETISAGAVNAIFEDCVVVSTFRIWRINRTTVLLNRFCNSEGADTAAYGSH